MTVDGVILLLDRASKQATMFPIQFALSKDNTQSDKEFYTKLWPTWIQAIISAGFTVQSTFVWIDKSSPLTTSNLDWSKRSGLAIKLFNPSILWFILVWKWLIRHLLGISLKTGVSSSLPDFRAC